MFQGPLTKLTDGFQTFHRHATCQRHRHEGAYAAIVLAGGYVEAGESGRYPVAAGDVVFHGAFDAHLDVFGSSDGVILNLQLPASFQAPFVLGRLRDLDRIVRLAERNSDEAACALLQDVVPAADHAMTDWPDILARDLWAGKNLRISAWAGRHGLARESVSRGFQRVYGVGPARFRAEIRARKAWRMLVSTGSPLSTVALQSGFCDQAHMTRAVHAVTGCSPGAWRKLHLFKTESLGPV